jgi:6-phosphogluconolactonase
MNLTFIDRYSSRGQSPVHISVDASGKFVFAANYNGGVGIVFTRNDDGSLQFAQQLNHSGSGPHPNQNASHLHMAKLSPDNNFLFFPDLGSDKIWSYRIDYESATLTKTNQEFGSVAAGAGPRHMDFHPSGNFAFVVNELNSTVTVFAYDSRSGALTEVQTISTLPEGFTAWNSSADIHVHPNGLFLYASNRGHNSIVTFSVDPATGELAVLGQTPTEGETPRNFAVAPTGDFLFVANQNSNNITVFTIGAGTGLPEFTGNQLEVPTPVCLVFY